MPFPIWLGMSCREPSAASRKPSGPALNSRFPYQGDNVRLSNRYRRPSADNGPFHRERLDT